MAMRLTLTTPTDGEAIERGEVKSRRDGDSSASRAASARAPGDADARSRGTRRGDDRRAMRTWNSRDEALGMWSEFC